MYGWRPDRNSEWTYGRGKKEEQLKVVLQVTLLVEAESWLRSPAVVNQRSLEFSLFFSSTSLFSAELGPIGAAMGGGRERAQESRPEDQLRIPLGSLFYFLFSWYLIVLLCNIWYMQRNIWHICVCYKTQDPPLHPIFLCGFFVRKKSSLTRYLKYRMPESPVCHPVSFNTSRLPFPRKVTQNPLEVYDAVPVLWCAPWCFEWSNFRWQFTC